MENQEEEITTVEVIGNDLQVLREKMSIDMQVSTAKQYPRNTRACLEEAITTVTMDVATASICGYAVPRGGKTITGPSVHMAKIIMQAWGNFRGDTKVIGETEKHVISEAVAWDLEKNVAVKVTVKRSITTSYGRMSEDMITVTGNAANSIALRNAIFSVIPRAITDKVYLEAQNKIIGDGTEAAFKKKLNLVLKGYKDTYSKDIKDVLSLVGKSELTQVVPADLIVLIGVAQALKDGDATADLVFRKADKTGSEKKQDLKDKKDNKTGSQAEML